jgi:hypothetical protein
LFLITAGVRAEIKMISTSFKLSDLNDVFENWNGENQRDQLDRSLDNSTFEKKFWL